MLFYADGAAQLNEATIEVFVVESHNAQRQDAVRDARLLIAARIRAERQWWVVPRRLGNLRN